MRLTAPVKLAPTPEQADALRRTITEANAAADWLSELAFESGTFHRYALHHLAYREVRARFALSAQAAIRVTAKVAAAYARDRRRQHRFRTLGAIGYDSRILRYFEGEVSIWTIDGRQRIPFVAGAHQRELLSSQRGESDLLLRDGQFYLLVGCEVAEPVERQVAGFLGVDLGVVNIATDSHGTVHSSGHLNGLRRRHRRLRGRLHAKRTRSAKRLLRQRRRREGRMGANVNHCISKRIVAEAERTGQGIALEDLRGIRDRVRARRSQRATLHSWSFDQLRRFVVYKAALAGVPVVTVDPRNTSRTCPDCGHCERANRASRDNFRCRSCGLAGPADLIAARNIAGRAHAMAPHAAGTGRAASVAQ